jgi:hypothetical protein
MKQSETTDDNKTEQLLVSDITRNLNDKWVLAHPHAPTTMMMMAMI